jgi:hypothetical protein
MKEIFIETFNNLSKITFDQALLSYFGYDINYVSSETKWRWSFDCDARLSGTGETVQIVGDSCDNFKEIKGHFESFEDMAVSAIDNMLAYLIDYNDINHIVINLLDNTFTNNLLFFLDNAEDNKIQNIRDLAKSKELANKELAKTFINSYKITS